MIKIPENAIKHEFLWHKGPYVVRQYNKPFTGISYYACETYTIIRYYKEGVLHREDGPAVKYYYNYKFIKPSFRYYLNGSVIPEDVKIKKLRKFKL